jgi:arylsulfatase A-like enzyme
MRPEEVSIAKIMKKAGYSTGHFGKWHLGGLLPDSKTSPKVAGFDKWVSALNFFDIDPWLSENGTPRQFTGESSEVTVDVAIDFIREQSVNDMPFFAVVWFGSPHVPHKGTEEDLALYADAPKDKQNFLAEMTALDRAVGKLRSALRDMNVADNTLFWYCSDNGVLKQGNAGGLRGLKGQMYEGGLRVPCLIEWPAKITGGRQSNMTASTMDIYPTLLELTGQKSAYQPLIDGESIAGLIEGKMTSRKKPIGFWYMGEKGVITRSDEILSSVATLQQACEKIPADHPAHGPAMLSKEWKEPANSYPGHSVWLDNEWKLHRIENKEGRSVRWELYNLEKDEAERNDVFSAQPEIADRMKAELKTWLKSVTDSIAGKDYPAEK